MAKQSELPGYEGKKIGELNDAAEVQFKLAKVHARNWKKMGENLAQLKELMEKHGIEVYQHKTHSPPITVRIKSGKTKVVVESDEGRDESGDEATVE